jgi:hypothetical protein
MHCGAGVSAPQDVGHVVVLRMLVELLMNHDLNCAYDVSVYVRPGS